MPSEHTIHAVLFHFKLGNAGKEPEKPPVADFEESAVGWGDTFTYWDGNDPGWVYQNHLYWWRYRGGQQSWMSAGLPPHYGTAVRACVQAAVCITGRKPACCERLFCQRLLFKSKDWFNMLHTSYCWQFKKELLLMCQEPKTCDTTAPLPRFWH